MPLEESSVARAQISLIHVLEPEQRVSHDHEVAAAVLRRLGVRSRAEAFVTAVEQRVLDRAAVDEVVFDTVVPHALEINVADAPRGVPVGVHADAVAIVEDLEILELERRSVNDHAVRVVHLFVWRRRRQLPDDLTAMETNAGATADEDRDIPRRQEL